MIEQVVEAWHGFLRDGDPAALDELLDDDVVFYSPIVFTPQRGKDVTALYLRAARQTFPGDRPGSPADEDALVGSFRYTRSVLSGENAVLEFETTMDGKYVNGVDIIRCNDRGRIVEFRVMIRPLQAVTLIHKQMAAMLETMAPTD